MDVTAHQAGLQYLSGLLIGMGVGGVVGASTLGVAIHTLIAPHGYLREFTAVIPVVNCCANIAAVSSYFGHAEWRTVYRMLPMVAFGIVIGQVLLPLLAENVLRKVTSTVYALVLVQQLYEKYTERARKIHADADTEQKAAGDKAMFYRQLWVSSVVSVTCGILTVICNNSGPVFNVYLLSIGFSMDQFVATRSTLMAGKNIAKVVSRAAAGGLPSHVAIHGLKLGALCCAGIWVAKPIKARTSTTFYKYFTWCVLAYTSVKMWLSSV